MVPMTRVIIVLLAALGACASDPAPDSEDRTCVDQHSPYIAPASNVEARTLPASTLYPSDPHNPGAEFVDGEWHIVAPYYMYYPLPVAAGERIAGYAWQVSKRTGPNQMAASIQLLAAVPQTVQGSVSSEHHTQCGTITVGTSQLGHVVSDGERYILRVAANAPDGSDTYGDAVLFVMP